MGNFNKPETSALNFLINSMVNNNADLDLI